MPPNVRSHLLKGFREEVFLKDHEVKQKLQRDYRKFAKPDIFLALLIANLPNLESFELHLATGKESDMDIDKPRSPRTIFPTWTWKIVALNAGDKIPRGLRSLQMLKSVTLSRDFDQLYCPQGLPWLRLPSLDSLTVSKLEILYELGIRKRSSDLQSLSLKELAFNPSELCELLEIPRALVSFSYNYCSKYKFTLSAKSCSSTEMIKLVGKHHAATIKELTFGLDGYHDLDRLLENIISKCSLLPSNKLAPFETLRSLTIQLWMLSNLLLKDDDKDPLMYKHEPVLSLVDFLPPRLESLMIGQADARLADPLKALAEARSFPTYKFINLRLVRVEIRRDGMLDEKELRVAFGGCKFELGLSPRYYWSDWERRERRG